MQHFKMLRMSPIFVLATRLMIQLPANALGKAVSEGALPTMWEMQMEFWILVLACPNPGCCEHLGSEPVDERSLSVALAFKSINPSTNL